MVFTVLHNFLTLGLGLGVQGNVAHCCSQCKTNGSKREMQHQKKKKQIRLLAYLFSIQAEFILVIEVKNVLKCIVMTMPLGNSTGISSVSSFKRA